MGCYVNPKDVSKESWLIDNGTRVGQVANVELDNIPSFHSFDADCLPVILIDNGHFNAAGVAFSNSEYKVFTNPLDGRARIIYSVKQDLLMDPNVSDLKDYAKHIER
jgi:hypothetical protein